MFFFKKKQIPLDQFFPEGFVDIHSHLLPGIDDGAKNMDETIALLQKMSSYGIKHFITTPHVLGNVYPNTPKIIQQQLQLVQDEFLKRNLTDFSIQAAAEYMIDERFMDILEKDPLLTLKDNFVLVEMSYYSPPLQLYDALFQMQLKGYKPILAHPERYFSYHHDFRSYYKLKTAGCLFQLNLLSLTEHYGKYVQNIAKKLLRENLYDFVGSDTHHVNHLELLPKIGTQKNLKRIEHLLLNNKKFLK